MPYVSYVVELDGAKQQSPVAIAPYRYRFDGFSISPNKTLTLIFGADKFDGSSHAPTTLELQFDMIESRMLIEMLVHHKNEFVIDAPLEKDDMPAGVNRVNP